MDAFSASVPIELQRFELGSLPKHRERLITGTSNRQAFKQKYIRELQDIFLKPHTANTKCSRQGYSLGLGEILCHSEYSLTGERPVAIRAQPAESEKMDTNHDQSREVRTPSKTNKAQSNKGSRFTVLNDLKEGIKPAPKSQRDRCPLTDGIATEYKGEMLPVLGTEPLSSAIATFFADNRRGRGHIKRAENYFISSPRLFPSRSVLKRILAKGETNSPMYRSTQCRCIESLYTHPVCACGGGQLEYDDPLINPYCRNALISRHHQLKCNTTVKSTSALSISSQKDTIRKEVVPTRLESTYSEQKTPEGETIMQQDGIGKNPISCKSSSISSINTSTTFEHIQRSYRVQEARWIASYSPSLRPNDVRPCRGRVGCTDYRPTFGLVQADPSSDLYASSAERFCTTQQNPLPTPNLWQLREKKEKKTKLSKRSHSQSVINYSLPFSSERVSQHHEREANVKQCK